MRGPWVVRYVLNNGLVKLTAYIMVGYAYYHSVERHSCDGEAEALARAGNHTSCECDVNDDCTEPWSAADTFYFVMVTMSTVGYGDLSPSIDSSKVFTVFYILVGIIFAFPVVVGQVSLVSAPLFAFARAQVKKLSRTLKGRWSLEKKVDLNLDGHADIVVPRSQVLFYITNLLPSVLIILVVQVEFAIGFKSLGVSTFGLAFYHTMVTATTVGYGDVSMSTDALKTLAFFHILVSVSSLGSLVADVDGLRAEYAGLKRRFRAATQCLNVGCLKALNTNGDDGVDKYEYVLGMMMQLELCAKEDVSLFEACFSRYDRDGSGKLSRDDFCRMLADGGDTTQQVAKTALLVKQTTRRLTSNARKSKGASPLKSKPGLPAISRTRVLPDPAEGSGPVAIAESTTLVEPVKLEDDPILITDE